MSEIRINIDDKYLQAFLAYLKTLSYVEVEKVTEATSELGNASEAFLDGLPQDSPLFKAVKPMRKGKVTAEDLIQESGFVRTDWEKVKEIGDAMDIPQSTEELLAQLSA